MYYIGLKDGESVGIENKIIFVKVFDIKNKYFWIKLFRYDSKFMEVGFLSFVVVGLVVKNFYVIEVVMKFLKDIKLFLEVLFLMFGRIVVRCIEVKMIVDNGFLVFDVLVENLKSD